MGLGNSEGVGEGEGKGVGLGEAPTVSFNAPEAFLMFLR